MAARRGKTQARRNTGNGIPGWAWLVAGLVLGAALFLIVPNLMQKEGDGFFRPQPNPDARPAPVADADAAADAEVAIEDASSAPAPKETQYDFYTLLPGKEVQVSDAELAASAREEEARSARSAEAGATDVAAQPTPLPEQVDSMPVAAAADASATTPATTTSSTASNARYILQAGAFGASGDAEATKARIAMLGLSARVEAAQIRGKTVYRVRMGPYGSASELAEAKQKLTAGGLPAMAIKAQ